MAKLWPLRGIATSVQPFTSSCTRAYVSHLRIRPAFFFPEQVLPLIGKTSAYSNSKDQPSFEVHACVSKGS